MPRRKRPTVQYAGGRGSARALLDYNAKIYVNAVINPFAAPNDIRIPDGSMIATATATSTERGTIAMCDGATSGTIGGIIVAPKLKTGLWKITAAGAVAVTDDFTFTNSDMEVQAEYASNFEMYRCVALGVRVREFGAVLSRGAELLIGQMPAGQALPANVDDILDIEGIHHIDLSTVAGDQTFWLPIGPPVANQSSVNETGTTFRAIAETSCTDTYIGAFCYSADGTISDSPSFEIRALWEVTVLKGAQSLFEEKTILGGQESIAVAWTEAGLQGLPDTLVATPGVYAGSRVGAGGGGRGATRGKGRHNKKRPFGWIEWNKMANHFLGAKGTGNKGLDSMIRGAARGMEVVQQIVNNPLTAKVVSAVRSLWKTKEEHKTALARHRIALAFGFYELSPYCHKAPDEARRALVSMSAENYAALVHDKVRRRASKDSPEQKGDWLAVTETSSSR